MITPGQCPADRLQRRRAALGAVDPVSELGGSRPLPGGQEPRNRQRHDRRRLLGGLPLLAGQFEQAHSLVGEAGQFRLLVGSVLPGLEVVGGYDLVIVIVLVVVLIAVLDEHPADVDAPGGRSRLLGLGFRFGFGFDEVLGQHFAQHQVRVGAAEPETGDAGDGMSAVSRPLADGVGHLEPYPVEVDIGVGAGVVDRRRDLVVAQCQRHLGKTGRPGRRLQVAHVGFHRTQQRRLVGGAAPADDPSQSVGLDGVAQDGAGAVRFDVVDAARIDPGVLVGAAQNVGLGVRVGRQHPVRAPVVVDRAAGDDGDDLVAVPAGVGEPFEHQHPAALGPGIAVGVGGERLDPAVRCEHSPDLVETECDGRAHQGVDSAGQHHIGLPRAQRLDALVDSHQ